MRTVIVGLLVIASMLAPGAPLQAKKSAEGPLVSALFFETDLREALSELVMLTGVNIIADDTVHGVVTLDLQDVSLEKALHMLLLGGGYTLRKIDDFYLVGLPDPRGAAFRHLANTESVRLRNITAGEALELLPAFYDGFVRADIGGNVMTITAPPTIIEQFKEDLRQIDTPKQMVTLQLIVSEVSAEALRQMGAHQFWFTAEDGNFRLAAEDGNVLGFAEEALSLMTGPGGDLIAQLKALASNNEATIRANPHVTVLDRETARLFVGERQVIILQPDNASTRIEEVDVGVTLEVTPRIVADDQIQLVITPEVSHFLNDRGVRRDDQFTVRRNGVSTTVFLVDGQTALIAGMTLEESGGQVRKVPILGDIPIVGWLFRQTTERVGERELLVFVTAHIENR